MHTWKFLTLDDDGQLCRQYYKGQPIEALKQSVAQCSVIDIHNCELIDFQANDFHCGFKISVVYKEDDTWVTQVVLRSVIPIGY